MLRTLAVLSLFTLLFSCGTDPSKEYFFKIDSAKNQVLFYHVKTPKLVSFEVTLQTNAGELKETAEFCLQAFRKYRFYSEAYHAKNGTVRLGPIKDLYQLYFQLAAFSMPDIRNELLRYGFIQSSWRNWVRESDGKADAASIVTGKWKYDLFLADDIEELFRSNNFDWFELDQVYSYATSYLLKQVLFISLQEMLARPGRYFNPIEYNTIFCQVVTLPEAEAFTGYLTSKYGMDRTLKIAREPFATNSWKSLTGEFFHDTEGDFTEGLENRKYHGKLTDMVISDKLNSMLKVYNKMTKSTLFRK